MRKVLVSLALFLFAAVAAAPAIAADDIEGGPGGTRFDDACLSGTYLAGVEVTTGDWIDSIKPYCVAYDPRTQRFGALAGRLQHGGQGGTVQQAYCPSGHFLTGMMFGYTRDDDDKPKFIDYVMVSCTPIGSGDVVNVCVATGQGCWRSINVRNGPFGDFIYPAFRQDCDAGEAAVGLRGRTGDFVDSLGLICGVGKPVTAALAAISAYCDSYTNAALLAINQNQTLACGYTGDRWSASAAAHLSWCMATDNDRLAAATAETSARAAALDTCKAQKRGIVQLPSNSGVLAQIPPAPIVPLPPGPTGPQASAVQKGPESAIQIPPRPPSNPLPPAPNGARSSAVQKGPASAILIQPPIGLPKPPAPPAAPTGPAGYLVTCQGGGMDASAGNDGFVRISFTFAAQGSDVVPPRAGECAWHDRGFRSGEPTMLVYAANGRDASPLLQAARNGGAFKVHAYNNGQGALVVTSLDSVSVASAPPPQSPSGGPATFPQPQGGTLGIAIVTRAVNVRTGPKNGNKVIGTLPAGAPVPIAGCDGSWCQLGLPFGLQIGWVSKQYLQF